MLAAIAVSIRFGYKLFIAHNVQLGWDDWLIAASLALTSISLIIAEQGTTPNGLGKDIWTLTSSQITNFSRFFWSMSWLYFLEVALTKLSMEFFYLRIFPSQGAQRSLWGTVLFTALWGVTYVLACIFQCRPINYAWTRWSGSSQGRCINTNSLTWSHAAINIALDFWLLLLPLWQIWGLQMSLKKKVGVATMFGVGTL